MLSNNMQNYVLLHIVETNEVFEHFLVKYTNISFFQDLAFSEDEDNNLLWNLGICEPLYTA